LSTKGGENSCGNSKKEVAMPNNHQKNYSKRYAQKKIKRGEKKQWFIQSKRASIAADPLLTNPLNSCTKLQIRIT
jgi:hypothetical protein